ncbi:MAG: hypothetical protein R2748_25090 [Bryobacterales bacterium]
MRRLETDAAYGVAGLVLVAGGELQAHLRHADLVELVEHAEDVDALFLADAGIGEQKVEDLARREAHDVAADLERFEGVAHGGHDLDVGDLRRAPTESMSNWVNWRKRPGAGLSARQTGETW